MKNGKNPSVRQRKLIQSKRLNPDNWFVVKDTPSEMVIVHRHQDTNVRVIQKEVK